MKTHFLLLAAAVLLLAAGCRSSEADASRDRELFTEARRLITSGEAECVVITADRRLVAERGRGVSPLLELYDGHAAEMKGSTVVDKVIGRAAAAICVVGNAKKLHALLIGADALTLLKAHGVEAAAEKTVPKILNRDLSDSCPMEQTVEGIDDPAEMVKALKSRLGM